jgi:flavin-dependent dehydrogenase
MTDFDVIILGGGPAGSTAATYLARSGQRVLILERATFPRFHVGESLLPYNRRIFEEMGLLEEIESQQYMVKHGAQFWLGNGRRHVEILFREGHFNEEFTAFQVERSKFDELLLRHAAKQGAEVREACVVTATEVGAEVVSATYKNGDSEHRVTGRFLIDATGQANFTGNAAGMKVPYKGHRKVAIFGHFTGVPLPAGERKGDIIIIRLEDGWFWLIPLSPEKVSVGLVCDVEHFKASGLSPQAMFDSVVAEQRAAKERMKSAVLDGKIHVISDYSYQNRQFVSPRLVRVGDAAGFLDPIFSSGVYLAMTSGRDAARGVADALGKNKSMTPELMRYQKQLRKEMGMYWSLIQRYYSTPFIDLFMTPDPPMKLRSAVNSVLAGRLHQSWSVRWRLWVFYFLVKLQRRFAIAPRTNFSR